MIADLDAGDVFADGMDDPGRFRRGNIGERGLALILPGDIERGGEAHPGGLVPDDNVIGAGLGIGKGFQFGHVLVMAEFANDYCAHVTLILTCSC